MYTVDTKELKKRMIDKGYDTIDSFSKDCDVNRNTLADIVNGRAFPSSAVMVKIGEALEIAGNDMGQIFFTKKLA